MSDHAKGSTAQRNAFLGCIPTSISAPDGVTLPLDPDNRAAIADRVLEQSRALYGGTPAGVMLVLETANRCAFRQATRSDLRLDIAAQIIPGFLPELTLPKAVPGGLLISREEAAAGLANDAAELIALAACSIQASIAGYVDTVGALSHGREAPPPKPNEFAAALSDILVGREVLPGKPAKAVHYDVAEDELFAQTTALDIAAAIAGLAPGLAPPEAQPNNNIEMIRSVLSQALKERREESAEGDVTHPELRPEGGRS